MRRPRCVTAYMRKFECTELEARRYILEQIGFYGRIQEKQATTIEQWIGFKLACSVVSAHAAIIWAKWGKHDGQKTKNLSGKTAG